jgi:hypothetical protein
MSRMKIAFCFAASILAIGVVPMISSAKPISYELPEETAAFGPDPNQDAVLGNCTACHSTKMIKVYGAPIDESDVGKIVDYLVATH